MTTSQSVRLGLMLCVLFLAVLMLPAGLSAQEQGRYLDAQEPSKLSSLQRNLQFRLAEYLAPDAIRGKIPLLLGLAALYGIVHSLGPGHQKTLLAGYFISEDASMGKVAAATLGLGVLHAWSALFLVGVTYLLERTLSAAQMDKGAQFIQALAGYSLVALSAWILYLRVKSAQRRLSYLRKQTKTGTPRFVPVHGPHGLKPKNSIGPGSDHDCPTCASLKKTRTTRAPLWGLVVAGGLLPCPGAAMLVLLSVRTGNFLIGGLAIIALSTGMSVTLFIVSIAARKLRQKMLASPRRYVNSSRHTVIRSALEIGGALMILSFSLALVI
ncbi:MAG: high-affinity nickel-transporter [Spirochaetes bacterium]|nr:MAG: high-affinity nickel-transporter [Spirochaetota bacterium]